MIEMADIKMINYQVFNLNELLSGYSDNVGGDFQKCILKSHFMTENMF